MIDSILTAMASPLKVFGWVLAFLVIGIPWLNGMFDFYMANRFARNHNTDRTAAFLNWNAFKWSWLNNLDELVEALPFMRKDLSETFGIREDDGNTS